MRTILRFLAAAAVGLVLLSTGAAAPAGASEPGLESQYVAGVNGVRANAGLPPLAVDGELTAVARAWADQMASQNRISHNPDLGSQVSAPWRKVGENVGTGNEVSVVMDAFVNSPAHYRNIVDADFEFIGVGVTYGSDGRMYTAHVFMDLDGGAPAPTPPPAPEPEPATTPATIAAAQAPTPSVPDAAVAGPAEPAPPAPPPAAVAPERVANVLTIVLRLDDGVA